MEKIKEDVNTTVEIAIDSDHKLITANVKMNMGKKKKETQQTKKVLQTK